MGSFISSSNQLDQKFGYFPDVYDQNDKEFRPNFNNKRVKKYINLKSKFPPVYEQKGLNCSTALAIASVIEYIQNIKEFNTSFVPSKLFLFYLGRYPDFIQHNKGFSIKYLLDQINKYGIASEKEYRFMPELYTKRLKLDLSDRRYYQGLMTYKKVSKDINTMKVCLSIHKKPVIFGFAVYESFNETMKWDNDMKMPFPDKSEKLIGFQTGVCVGYSSKKSAFLIRNSWGPNWKDEGYFFMSFDYFLSPNCDDLWVFDIVSDLELDEEHFKHHHHKNIRRKKVDKKDQKKFTDEIKVIIPGSQSGSGSQSASSNFLIQAD
jgi:hypothetical protein